MMLRLLLLWAPQPPGRKGDGDEPAAENCALNSALGKVTPLGDKLPINSILLSLYSEEVAPTTREGGPMLFSN